MNLIQLLEVKDENCAELLNGLMCERVDDDDNDDSDDDDGKSLCRSLGLCVACGGLRRVHCSKCKGRGRVMPGWNFMNILPQLMNAEELNPQNSSPCKSCTGKGHFPCTSCSNMEAI